MVHFPPNFNTTTQRPLVLNLHGGSGNMVNAQGFSMLNPVSDQNNFIVAWPQGYGITPPGFLGLTEEIHQPTKQALMILVL